MESETSENLPRKSRSAGSKLFHIAIGGRNAKKPITYTLVILIFLIRLMVFQNPLHLNWGVCKRVNSVESMKKTVCAPTVGV